MNRTCRRLCGVVLAGCLLWPAAVRAQLQLSPLEYVSPVGIALGPVYHTDGSVAAPSITFASDTNTGRYWIGADNVGESAGGALVFDWNTTRLNLASAYQLAWADDLFLTREAAATLQLGADAAGVTNQMIKGPDRITSDGVGGNLTIAGGRNRGASAGGSIIFQTSPAAGAGVTGTLATALTIDSDRTVTFTGLLVGPLFYVNVDGQFAFNGRLRQKSSGDGLLVVSNWAESAGVGFDVLTDAILKVRTRAQTGYATIDTLAYQMNGAGNATSSNKIIKSITAFTDAAAKDLFTVTIPNAAHAGTVKVTLVGSIGAGGAVGAFECSATLDGSIVFARTAGVNAVATAAAAEAAASACVAGATTVTLGYNISAVAGAVGASNTFTVQGTITKGGGASDNHTMVAMAELINSQATGITIE